MESFENKENVVNYFREKKKIGGSNMVPHSVKNLYSFLKTFADNRCLVAINNFVGVNIEPTIVLPVIARKFDLALLKREYISPYESKLRTYSDLIWIPKELVQQLRGKFSISMQKSEEIIRKNGKC